MIKYLSIGCFFFLPYLLQAQSAYEQTLVIDFEEKARRHARPIEYLQTDKDIYETGEAIWFNFFQIDGQYLTPFSSDSVLYLRMVHQVSRDVVWEERYVLSDGFSTGQLVIGEDVFPGIYQIEAYTPSAMEKGMTHFYAFKEIEIRQFILPPIELRYELPDSFEKGAVGTLTVVERIDRLQGADVSLSFLDAGKKVRNEIRHLTDEKGEVKFELPVSSIAYLDISIRHQSKAVFYRIEIPNEGLGKFPVLQPESSKLVSGHESWVNIKRHTEANIGSQNGALLADGELLQYIAVNEKGLGKFKFIPKQNTDYHVVWEDFPKDTLRVFESIESAGVTMTVDNSSDTLLFHLQTTHIQEKHILRLQSRGIVYAYLDFILPSRGTVKIPKSDIPTGIVATTVFNEDGELLTEQLIWNENNGRLILRANLDKNSYGNRDKVKLRITVEDELGRAVENVRIFGSVFDELYSRSSLRRSFFSQVHVLSQLKPSKDYRLFPNVSFNAESGVKNDNLLTYLESMNYRWSVVQNVSVRDKLALLSNVQKGTIRYGRKKGEQESSYALFFRGDDESGSSFIPLDAAGNFEILPEDLLFAGNEYLYIKALPIGNQSVEMRIENSFEGIEETLKESEFVYAPKIKNLEKSVVPRPVFDRNEILLNEFLVSARRLNLDNRDKYIISLNERANRDFNNDFVCKAAPGILNCPVCGHTDIKPIEGQEYTVILNESFKNQTLSGHHKITDFYRVIYKYPTYTEEELMKLYNVIRTKGFFTGIDFAHIAYPDEESRKRLESDYRSTLTWEPSLFTDENGRVELEFYTSDIRSIFTGNFEALSPDGKMGQVIFEFVVE
ncbi:MAG: hypothetical protein ACXIUD_00885 [Mongoliitalea sp.]